VDGRLGKRMGAAGSALRTVAANRDLRRAQLSFAFGLTAEWVLTVALGVVAFRAGGTTAVGAVAFLRMVPAAILLPWATALADHFPRDRVLRWACCLRAVAIGGAASVLAFDGPVVAVYALAVAQTVTFAIYRPAHSALLPALCRTPLELTSAYVARGLIDAGSTFVGPVIAAVLLGVSNAASTFTVAAALSLGAAWFLGGLSYEAPTTARLARPRASDLVAGFRALTTYRDAGLLVLLGAVQTFTRGCLNVLMLVVAIELLGGSDADVGALTAVIGAGAVVGSLAVSMLRSGRRLAVLLGAGVALWGLPLVAVGAFPRPLVVVSAMAVIGVGNALVDVGLFTLPARLVPDALLARCFGALESVISVAVAVGSLVTPLVIAGIGSRWTRVGVGSVGALALAVSSRRLGRIDQQVTVRTDAINALQRIAMLRPLPMPAIEILAANSDQSTVPAGGQVFAQGEHGDRFYAIEHGDAVVMRDGRRSRALGPGDCFGEIALLRDVPRTATVIARTDLQLRSIDREHFLNTVNGYASSASSASTLVSDRLADDDTTQPLAPPP